MYLIQQALEPRSGPVGDWRAVRVEKANKEEFHELLGRKIHQRLESRRHGIPAWRRLFNAFLTMTKIGSITYLSLLFFFTAASLPWMKHAPVLGLTLVLMFVACGVTFGKRDGFGIAVGVYHLLILCESLVRWKLGERLAELEGSYGTVCAYLLAAAGCAMMEVFVATCFGLSLGLGMACMFCVSTPEFTDYFRDGNPLALPEMHMLLLSCLFGLSVLQNRYARLLIPAVMVLLLLLPSSVSGFIFVCGTVCGAFHGIFLAVGRSLFLTLNYVIKSVATTPLGRHMVRHGLGLLPGLVYSRCIFGWSLVTSPTQVVLAHLVSAVALIAVNEIDGVSLQIVPCLSITFSSPSSSSCAPSGASSSSPPNPSSSTSTITFTSSATTPTPTPTPPASTTTTSTSSSKAASLSPRVDSPSSSSSVSSPASLPPNVQPYNKSVDHLSLSRSRSDSESLTTGQPTSVLASSTPFSSPLTPRLVVRDFAGHPLYYSAHHVYMAAQCVYVLVFSMVEARQRFPEVLRHLIQWLQSIFLHTAFPDTRVFIVGTHRDDPNVQGRPRGKRTGFEAEDTDGEFVRNVGHRLKKEIPRHFHNMLVWTDRDTPLFPVENSIRDHRDADHRYSNCFVVVINHVTF